MGKNEDSFRVLFLAAGVAALLTLTSCNIQGFLTKQGDDPVWVDPTPAKQGAGATAEVPGAALFRKNCAACHQATGKGLPGSIPPLAGSAMAQNDDATKPIQIVLHGFAGQIERNGTKYNGQMQSWKSVFNDEQIAQILTYVRSSFGNKASEVTPDMVKDVREKTALRSGPMNEPDLEKPL